MPIRISTDFSAPRSRRRRCFAVSACAPTAACRPRRRRCRSRAWRDAARRMPTLRSSAAITRGGDAHIARPPQRIGRRNSRRAGDAGGIRQLPVPGSGRSPRDRWLELNPTSEQAQRYAGVAALKLHRLDEAEKHFASLLDTVYISPAAGFLALLPVIGGEAVAGGRHGTVPCAFRRVIRRSPKATTRSAARRCAPTISPLARDVGGEGGRARAVLEAGQDAARACADRQWQGGGRTRDWRATWSTEPESDIATHLEYAMMLAATGRDEEARAMLTPYATGKTVVPGAVRALGVLDLDAGNLDAAERAVRGIARDRGAILRGALLPRRDRRAAQGCRARDALLLRA